MSALDPDQLGNGGAIASAPEIYETEDPVNGLWDLSREMRIRLRRLSISWRS